MLPEERSGRKMTHYREKRQHGTTLGFRAADCQNEMLNVESYYTDLLRELHASASCFTIPHFTARAPACVQQLVLRVSVQFDAMSLTPSVKANRVARRGLGEKRWKMCDVTGSSHFQELWWPLCSFWQACEGSVWKEHSCNIKYMAGVLN